MIYIPLCNGISQNNSNHTHVAAGMFSEVLDKESVKWYKSSFKRNNFHTLAAELLHANFTGLHYTTSSIAMQYADFVHLIALP